MNDWSAIVPGLFGLVGAIIGAMAAYQATLFQFHRQSQAERRRFLLGRLEELFSLITEMRTNYATVYVNRFKPVMKPSDVGNALIQGNLPSPSDRVALKDFQTIDMTILYYFRDMKASLEALKESRQEFKLSLNKSQEELGTANMAVAKALDALQTKCIAEAERMVASWNEPDSNAYESH